MQVRLENMKIWTEQERIKTILAFVIFLLHKDKRQGVMICSHFCLPLQLVAGILILLNECMLFV